MNEILPADARRYFFFDGERIDDMSKPGHEEQVRDALRSVLKLKVLERAILHLTAVEREFAQAVKNADEIDGAAAELVTEMEQTRELIAALKEAREAKHVELETCERQIEEVEDTLRSLEGIREIMFEEAKIDSALSTAEERCSFLIAEMQEKVGRAGPAIAVDAVHIAAAILDEKRKRGEIPSSIRQQLIDDLVREGICICDRHLDAASRKALMRRRDTAVSDEMEDVVLQVAGHLNGLAGLSTEVPERLSEVLAEYEATTERMEDLQREKEGLRKRISEQLRDKTPEGVTEDVRGLESARRERETRRGDLRHDSGSDRGATQSARAGVRTEERSLGSN